MVEEEEVESSTEKNINTETKKEEGADGVDISLDAFKPEQASQLEVEPSKVCILFDIK
jgi:biotin synthase-related radical SAM superfamily protein